MESKIACILQGDRFNEEDTLILTALSSTPDQSTQDPPDAKTREVFFATVLTKLRKRGISLRHQVCGSQRTLTMFVGVVALRYQHVVLITKCHNSCKHSQSLLTMFVMLLPDG